MRHALWLRFRSLVGRRVIMAVWDEAFEAGKTAALAVLAGAPSKTDTIADLMNIAWRDGFRYGEMNGEQRRRCDERRARLAEELMPVLRRAAEQESERRAEDAIRLANGA